MEIAHVQDFPFVSNPETMVEKYKEMNKRIFTSFQKSWHVSYYMYNGAWQYNVSYVGDDTYYDSEEEVIAFLRSKSLIY